MGNFITSIYVQYSARQRQSARNGEYIHWDIELCRFFICLFYVNARDRPSLSPAGKTINLNGSRGASSWPIARYVFASSANPQEPGYPAKQKRGDEERKKTEGYLCPRSKPQPARGAGCGAAPALPWKTRLRIQFQPTPTDAPLIPSGRHKSTQIRWILPGMLSTSIGICRS
jgi:hypothetical protein